MESGSSAEAESRDGRPSPAAASTAAEAASISLNGKMTPVLLDIPALRNSSEGDTQSVAGIDKGGSQEEEPEHGGICERAAMDRSNSNSSMDEENGNFNGNCINGYNGVPSSNSSSSCDSCAVPSNGKGGLIRIPTVLHIEGSNESMDAVARGGLLKGAVPVPGSYGSSGWEGSWVDPRADQRGGGVRVGEGVAGDGSDGNHSRDSGSPEISSPGLPGGTGNMKGNPTWSRQKALEGSWPPRTPLLGEGERERERWPRVPQPSPPTLASADQHSISLEWAETPHCACYYLEMAPEKSEFRGAFKQKGTKAGAPLLMNVRKGSYSKPAELAEIGKETSSDWPEWAPVYCGKERNYKLENLRPGRRYLFRLRVVPSPATPLPTLPPPPSVPTAFATLPSVPEPPSAPVLVNRARNSLKVKWVPSPDNGGMSITEFCLEICPRSPKADGDPRSQAYVQVYKGEEPQAKLSRLQPGVQYLCRVRAVNFIGASEYSPPAAIWTAPSVPATPAAPTPTSTTLNSVTVEWQEPLCCGSPVTRYTLEIDQGGMGSFSPVYSGEDRSCEVRGLRSGTTYRFRVIAQNDVGSSLPSTASEICTGIAPPQPPTPPAVAALQPFSAAVVWREPSDNGGSPVLGYQLEVKQSKAGKSDSDMWQVAYEGPATVCSLGGLRPGHQYWIRVQARNAMGVSGHSGEAMFTTAASIPDAPPPPALLERMRTSLTLCWSPPAHNGGAPITKYRLEMQRSELRTDEDFMAERGSGRGSMCVYSGPELSATVDGLKPNTAYSFRLQAGNMLGASLWSSVETFVTQIAPPAAPDAPMPAFSCTATTIPLRWNAPESNGAPILGYRLQMLNVGYGCRRMNEVEGVGYPLQGGGDSSPLRLLDGPEGGAEGSPFYRTPPHRSSPNFDGPFLRSPARSLSGGGPSPAALWDLRRRSRESGLLPLSMKERVSHGHGHGSEVSGNTSEGDADLDGGSLPVMGGCDTWTDAVSDTSSQYSSALGFEFQDVYHGPALAHTVTRLQPYTTYAFRVQALNRVGTGPMSTLSLLTTAAGVPWPPGAPSVLHISGTEVAVQWEAPNRDNGAPVTSFSLQMMCSDGANIMYDACPGLRNGRTQSLVFCDENFISGSSKSLKESSSSSSISSLGSFSPAGHLYEDKGGSVGKLGRRRKGSSRSVSMGNLMVASGVNVGGRLGSPEKWEEIYCGIALEYRAAGLESGKRYSFRVLTRNAIGESPCSPVTTVAMEAAPPEAPRAPQHSNAGPTSVRIKWNSPHGNNGAPVSSYKLSMDDGKGGSFRKVYEGGATTFKVTRLVPARTYRFRVQAVNSQGCSPPSDVAAITLPLAPPVTPSAPEILSATKVAISLRWTPGNKEDQSGGSVRSTSNKIGGSVLVQRFSSDGEGDSETSSNSSSSEAELSSRYEGCAPTVSYTLEMEERGGAEGQFAAIYEGTETRFEARGLQPGQSYRFRVRSNGPMGGGSSAWSPISLGSTEPLSESVNRGEKEGKEAKRKKVVGGAEFSSRQMLPLFAGLSLALRECASSMAGRFSQTHIVQIRRFLVVLGTVITLVAAYCTKV